MAESRDIQGFGRTGHGVWIALSQSFMEFGSETLAVYSTPFDFYHWMRFYVVIPTVVFSAQSYGWIARYLKVYS